MATAWVNSELIVFREIPQATDQICMVCRTFVLSFILLFRTPPHSPSTTLPTVACTCKFENRD